MVNIIYPFLSKNKPKHEFFVHFFPYIFCNSKSFFTDVNFTYYPKCFFICLIPKKQGIVFVQHAQIKNKIFYTRIAPPILYSKDKKACKIPSNHPKKALTLQNVA